GALSIFGLNPADSTPLKGNYPDPAKVETLMMGRRSTRRYKDEPVDAELLDQIMEVVRNAPTGVNSRSTLFTLVEGPAAMEALRNGTYDGLRKAVETEALPPGLEFFGGILKAWDNGVDIIYRGAPHFLVTSAPTQGPSGPADTIIAMSYFELLANSHGLGTVWNGLAKWALTVIAPEAGTMLGIPDDHAIGYMMAFGKPAVKYHRTVQRPGGTVNKVTV
ncbi:nitroreductase family protein, partial [Pseudodesulfovibrio sp.]|nr:nitroreductase family protein [Pseudodesulfovibrio sp.]